MSSIPIQLAVEDELSEAVLRKVIATANAEFAIGRTLRRGGFGYLRRTIAGWNEAAKGIPYAILTDLDDYPCPSQLIADWIDVPIHPNLLFRIAVREVEAWLLADRTGLSRFLGVAEQKIPAAVEVLPDPKATLISLADQSPKKSVRRQIVPRVGSKDRQGPEYNPCLISFVDETWNIRAAAATAPSLDRALRRLSSFSPTWPRP